MSTTLKILLSYHKPDHLFKDSILTPVHAGRAIALAELSPDDEKLMWLMANTIGDDTGENISAKNRTCNEMTTIYWAWKNYDIINSPDYIGFMHYRRHFIFDPYMSKSTYECLDITEDYYEQIKYSKDNIMSLLNKCDFICPKPQWRKSMYEHFRLNHNIQDLDTAIAIIKQKYPEYAKATDTYLSGHNAYFCNMFIFPKDIFFEYAEWIFDIIPELMKQIDFTDKRLFISEWLTGIFITNLLQHKRKATYLPIMIAEGHHEIPVVMAADNGYAYPMIAATASILQSAQAKTIYNFYFLISEDFTDENKTLIDNICTESPNCNYHFIEMHNAYTDAHISIEHITLATYYRLKLPSLLPGINKCIYLDTDTIVKEDLSALYRTCIDDKYIAGVRALGYMQTNEQIENKLMELGIESLDQYVNAGVLLMNLDKMRRDNLEDVFDHLLLRNYSSQDQDILNVACYGKIRLLPIKYNAMTKYPLYSDVAYNNTEYLQKWIEKSDWDEGRKRPTIIHYLDKKKPCNDLSSLYAEDWWNTINSISDNISAKVFDHYLKAMVDNAFQTEQARKLAVAHKRDALNRINNLQNGKIYKIKRIILSIPEKISRGFQCIQVYGVRYTIKIILKKFKLFK